MFTLTSPLPSRLLGEPLLPLNREFSLVRSRPYIELAMRDFSSTNLAKSEKLGSLPGLPEAGSLIEYATSAHLAHKCIGKRFTIRLKFSVLSTSEANPNLDSV